jgi:glucose-6-phosphate 1-epimerase
LAAERTVTDASLVTLRNTAGAQALVTLEGAQLLSWRPAGAGEQLYASPTSRPVPGRPVRGGVPICFPQFAQRGPLPKHGFARTRHWQLVSAPAPQSAVAEASFQLDSAMTSTIWQHAFCLVLVVRLGPDWLELELQVANTGRTPFEFTGALHTYFAVDDVRTAAVRGLQGLRYEDSAGGGVLHTDAAPEVAFAGEVDRIYFGTPEAVELAGGGMPLRRITQQGFADTVVWNPGPEKAATLGDMPAQDWVKMVCVEAAAVERPVEVAPGKTWRGTQRVAVIPA